MSIEHLTRSSRNCVTIALAALGAALTIMTAVGISQASPSARSESAPPSKHQRIGVVSLGKVSEESMEKQIGLRGYVLQLRKISIAPGGVIAMHSHANRPGLVWTTEGTWIEGRDGRHRADVERAYPAVANKALVEDADTVHWVFNRGSAPASAVVCDIVPAR